MPPHERGVARRSGGSRTEVPAARSSPAFWRCQMTPIGSVTGPTQLGQTGIGQAEVVGDLVERGLLDRVAERPRVAMGPNERAAEDRDLARDRGRVRSE